MADSEPHTTPAVDITDETVNATAEDAPAEAAAAPEMAAADEAEGKPSAEQQPPADAAQVAVEMTPMGETQSAHGNAPDGADGNALDLSSMTTEQLKQLTYDTYKSGDTELSKLVHAEKSRREHTESHGGAGADVIKSIVFGGLDGIITTFAIVAAVAGASLDIRVIILMGFSNLLADGLSMGLGDYLSSAAELEFQRAERAKEAWEYNNDPEGEKAEMVELYVDKLGFSEEDARAVIGIYTSKPEYADAFVDHMCTLELEFMPPAEDENPAYDGFVTFCSFVAFGSVPMWLYVICYAAGYDDPESDNTRFGIACAVTALTMFALGYVKAFIGKQGNALKSGLLMMLNGSLAAASAYFVGWGLEAALDVQGAC